MMMGGKERHKALVGLGLNWAKVTKNFDNKHWYNFSTKFQIVQIIEYRDLGNLISLSSKKPIPSTFHNSKIQK